MADVIDIILKISDKGSGTVKEITKELQALDKESKGVVARGLSDLENMLKVGIVGAVGAASVALGGLGAALGSSVMKAASMEQGVANIAAAMQLTAEETSQVKELITDLGIDPKLKVTAEEAASAIEMLGKNGLSVSQIMEGAARSTVLLANSTDADFSRAADIATDVMAQFNIGAEEMQRAVDQITGVTIASKFSINDYGLALAQAGGVASSVGVEFEDFNAVIAAISPLFASGSDAGTSYKTFLTRLVPASNEARDAMRDLGLFTGLSKKEFEDVQEKIQKVNDKIAKLDPTSKNYAQRLAELNKEKDALNKQLVAGSNAFFDEQGNIKDAVEITRILSDAVAGLTEEQINEAFATIFGADAMRAAFGLVKAGVPEIERLKQQIGDTSAEEAAATRMNTFAGALEIAEGVVDAISMAIGDKFLPVLRPLVERFTELAEEHGPKLIDFAGEVAAAFALFFNFLEEGEPVLTALNAALITLLPEDLQQKWLEITAGVQRFIDIVQGIFQPLTNAITQFFSWKDILGAVGALLLHMIIPTIGSFLAAIAPAVTVFAGLVTASALLRTAWEDDWLGIRTALTTAWDTISGIFNSVAIKVEWVLETFRTTWDALEERNASLFERLSAVWEMIRGVAEAVWQGIVTAVQILWPQFRDAVMEWATSTWDWIVENTPIAVEKIQEWGTSLWEWVRENTSVWSERLQEWARAAWQWIVDVIPIVRETLGIWFSNIVTWLGDNLPDFIRTVYEWGTALWEWIADAIPNAINALADYIKGIREKGDQAGGSSFVTMVSQWAETLWRWIVDDLVPEVGPAFMEYLSAISKAGLEILKALGNLAKELGLILWQWIVDAIPAALKKLHEWGGKLWDWITDNAPTWSAKLGQWAARAWQWIRDEAIPVALQKISEWGSALWNWVSDNWPIWRDKLLEWGEAAWTWITNVAIPEALKQIKQWAEDLWNWVSDNWETWRDKLLEWGEAAWTWIRDEAIPGAIETLREWSEKLIEWLEENWPKWRDKMLEIGKNIIEGLREGIKEKWLDFKQWWNNWGPIVDLINLTGNLLGIRSPSRVMWGYGQDVMEGLRLGITETSDRVGDAMRGVVQGLKSEVEWVAEQIKANMKRMNDEMLAEIDYFTQKAEQKALASHQQIAKSLQNVDVALRNLGVAIDPSMLPETMGGTRKVIGFGPNGELILEPVDMTSGKKGKTINPNAGMTGTPFYGELPPTFSDPADILTALEHHLAAIQSSGGKGAFSDYLEIAENLILNASEDIRAVVAPWFDFWKSEGDPANDMLLDVIEALKNLPEVAEEAAESITTIGDALGLTNVKASVGQSAISLLGGITLTATDLTEAQESLQEAKDSVKKIVDDFVEGLGDFITGTLSKTNDIFNIISEKSIEAFNMGEQVWKEWLGSDEGTARQRLREIFFGIRDDLIGILGHSTEGLQAASPEGALGVKLLLDSVGEVLSTINENTNFDLLQPLLQKLVDFRTLANKVGEGFFDNPLPTDARLTGGSTVTNYNITLQGTNNTDADLIGIIQLLQQLNGTAIA